MKSDALALFRMFPHAVAAGVVTAAVCAMLGVFVVLRRVVFIGIVLSEAAACGVALALVCGVPPFLGAVGFTMASAALTACPWEARRLSREAVLGVLFVLVSAAGVLLVSQSAFGLEQVKSVLYGDLILSSPSDLTLLLVTLPPVAALLLASRRPILYAFLDREASRVLGMKVVFWEALFFGSLAIVISAASKITGSLLVFCYLVVAPATALVLARRFHTALILAATAAVSATLLGMLLSFIKDLPTNPTICAVSCVGAGVAFVFALLRKRRLGPSAH
jgi:ABC-type Mn2+/Zn2+ transport system permease subunit